MDNKRMWIGMALVIGVVLLWIQLVLPWLAKKNNWDLTGSAAKSAQTSTDNSAPAAGTAPTTAPAATTGQTPATAIVIGGPSTRPVILGSIDYDPNVKSPHSPFPLGLTLSPRGASIQSVTLTRFRNESDKPTSYVFQEPYEGNSPLARALATRSVTIDGGAPIQLDSLDWRLADEPTANIGVKRTASFVAEIPNQLRITKTYEVRDATDKSAGYEVAVTYALQNLTDHPIKPKLAFNGTNSPKPENNRDVPEIVGGFDAGRQTVNIGHNPTASIKDTETFDVKGLNAEQKLLWAGMASAYFDAIVRATDAAGVPLPLAAVKANVLTPNVADPLHRAVAVGYETTDFTVPPASQITFTLNAFFGPKLRDVLRNDYYATYPLSYDDTLVLKTTSGIGFICGFCTWDWLINLLVQALRALHVVLQDWGLAIIGLVIVVRLLLHPVTKRSQISMTRMTKMGPELERLKKKYGDDEEGYKKAQVEFYREQGVAPFLGCLPMFLQMPIWIALWSSLQSTFEIRHAPFLWGFTWIKDLAQPDRLIYFPNHPVNFFFIHFDALNLLPIIMGIIFYINQKFQPQPVATTDQQKQQQQMMKWMSVFLFPLFLYGSPSGLNLYIFTSTLIGIFESKRIRDHIKEREEREKAGVVIVDGDGPPKGGAPGSVTRRPKPAPTGGIAGFMAKLQQMAEDAKKEQDKRGKAKK